MFNLCKSPLKQPRYKCFKDIAEAKFLTYEFIPRWVSLAALSRIFCQQLDINLEANGEQTKKSLLTIGTFWRNDKKFSLFYSNVTKKQQQQQKTNKQTKKHPTEATRPFAIHSLTWSLESSRLKNAARIHTHPRRTIDDQSSGEQRRRQFSRTIERAYSSVLENFAAVFPDPADLAPKDTKRDPLLSWYNFTLAIFAAYNHRH